jgi:hypothetical protein
VHAIVVECACAQLLPAAAAGVQRATLPLLLLLLDSDAAYQRRLVAAHGLRTALAAALRACDEPLRDLYVQCVALLGRYSIVPAEARLLVRTARRLLAPDAASDAGGSSATGVTRSAHLDEPAGVAMLAALCALAARRTPPAYFHFDGVRGANLLSEAIERFPASRTGYTISCWLRTEHFLDEESGLFAWLDQVHCGAACASSHSASRCAERSRAVRAVLPLAAWRGRTAGAAPVRRGARCCQRAGGACVCVMCVTHARVCVHRTSCSTPTRSRNAGRGRT